MITELLNHIKDYVNSDKNQNNIKKMFAKSLHDYVDFRIKAILKQEYDKLDKQLGVLIKNLPEPEEGNNSKWMSDYRKFYNKLKR